MKRRDLAIVGIGCRYPGDADTPKEFYELLRSGRDAFREIPEERWNLDRFTDTDPTTPARSTVREAALIDERRLFEMDSEFFGLTPREAEALDPQQRLLLETSWEAFEDAGIKPVTPGGRNIGVYVGAFTLDNSLILNDPMNAGLVSAASAAAATSVMMSNRLSFFYNFHGPSLTMDTACSSSLVALHYACRDLWDGKTDGALVAGVNAQLHPTIFNVMSKGGFLSPNARCRTFDADADGYARGEGAGVIVLKPLDKALEDDDRVYAVIKGAGVNQDGRTMGISAPNGEAQRALIDSVFKEFKLSRDDVVLVEAHGTGTAIGDPTEVSALTRALGQRSDDAERFVGSVKGNIGHQEGGAGIAGVIKAALCLYNEEALPQCNLNTLNPDLSLEDGHLRIPSQPEPLPDAKGQALACVNSFGYGGTNAHAVLGSAHGLKVQHHDEQTRTPLNMVVLSARSDTALRQIAAQTADVIENAPERYVDVIDGLQRSRSHLERRLAFAASTPAEALEKLRAFSSEDEEAAEGPGVEQGMAAEDSSDVVFVYTGMGPQWWRMGRELYESEPVFKSAIEEADALFAKHSGWSILEEMLKDEEASSMTSNKIAQPANFVMQHALTQLLASWGVKPQLIVGHSVGEIAAAAASGALTLDDAAKVAYHRSRVQQMRAGQGRMLATGLDHKTAKSIVKLYSGTVSLAAINAPNSMALSGDFDALTEIAGELEDQGTFHRFIVGEVAYHSHQMDGLRDELTVALDDIEPRKPLVRMFSSVTGREIKRKVHDAGYWWRNVRQPVEFSSVVEALAKEGYRNFIEIGPHPVLGAAIREIFSEASSTSVTTVPSLLREKPEHDGLMRSIAQLWCNGSRIEWSDVEKRWHNLVPLYPWQRARHWRESRASQIYRTGKNEHPLLGIRLAEPLPTWEVLFPSQILSFFADHVIGGNAIFPAAGYVETFLAVCGAMSPDKPYFLSDVRFEAMLPIPENDTLKVRTTVADDRMTFHAKTVAADGEWRQFAAARLVRQERTADSVWMPVFDRADPLRRFARDEAYRRLAKMGLEYKDAFQTIESVCIYEGGVEGTLTMGPKASEIKGLRSMPALFDGGLQLLALVFENQTEAPLPVQVSFVSMFTDQLPETVNVVGELQWNLSGVPGARLLFLDDEGRPLMELSGIQSRPIRLPQASATGAKLSSFAFRWREHDELIGDVEDLDGVLEATAGQAQAGNGGNGSHAQNGNGSSNGNGAKEAADDASEEADESPGIAIAYAGAGGALVRAIQEKAPTSTPSRRYKAVVASAGEGVSVTNGEADGEAVEDAAAVKDAAADEPQEFVVWCADDKSGIEPSPEEAWRLAEFARNLPNDENTRLVVCTRNAWRVAGDDHSAPGHAALWGVARSLRNELGLVDVLCVDFDEDPESFADFWSVLELLPANAEVAIRQGKTHFWELDDSEEAHDRNCEVPVPVAPEDRFGWDLETDSKRGIDGLSFRMSERRKPKADEIEICVDAVSINFKDILKVYGRLTDQTMSGTFSGGSIGLEAVGTVVRAGASTDYEPGEQVIFMAREGCFRKFVNLSPGNEIVLRWGDLPFTSAEKASIPIVFFTAHYGLLEVGRLAKGETVLLHSAAGGVGHAAIQVARTRGAEIVATAGTPEKRDYLRSLGVQNVFDSRSLDFEQQVLKATSGRGVDVILNFLPDAQLHANLRILRPFGRLVEIGKLDIGMNRGLPLAEFERNLTFASVDFDHMSSSSPELCLKIAEEIRERFANGDYRPSQVTTWPASDIRDCFRELADGRHIGKHVVDFTEAPDDVLPMSTRSPAPRSDASYVVTGGFGGFGLKTAEWLVRNGAGCVVLVGRTPRVSEELAALRELAAERSAHVAEVACDVGRLSEVRRLLTRDVEELPAVRGIFHAAAVLADALLPDQSLETFETAFHAKAIGAYNLHRASREFAVNLDYFVLYSSISGVIGNVGQSNYAAANTYLDALAEHRREKALPAVSIAWGAIGDAGMLERDEAVARVLEARGIKPVEADRALDAAAPVIAGGTVNTCLFEIDWETFGRLIKVEKGEPLWPVVARAMGTGTGSDLADRVAGMSQSDAISAIQEFIVAELARVTGRDVDNIIPERSLHMQGLDSLMVVELQIALEQSTGVDMNLTINDMQLSIIGLSETIYERIAASQPGLIEAAEAIEHVASPDDLDVESLTDEQVEMILDELLPAAESGHDETLIQ